MIFISYRISDALDLVGRLEADLARLFGPGVVFWDKSRLEAGKNWTTQLADHARGCRVLLAVIGATWQSAVFADGDLKGFPRLSDPDDWVRKEITFALDAGRAVVPVFLNGATMPSAGWLDRCGLRRLYDTQGVPLRSGEYAADFAKLVAEVRRLCPELAGAPDPRPAAAPGPDPGRLVREYLANEARAHARLQLPLVSETGLPVVAPIAELRIDLPMVVGHECAPRDPAARLRWLGLDVLAIHDEFRSSHTHAVLVDRASRHEDVRRDCTLAERLRPGARAVVVGDPGCGKSTLLQWVAHHYATRPAPAGDGGLPDRDWVPVLVLCRDFAGKPLPGTLADLLANHLKVRQYDDRDAGPLARALEQALAAGRAVLLVDGLDEVPDPGDRLRFARLLGSLAVRFADAPIVVTSRVVGFQAVREELAAGFDHLVVGPLDRAARGAFLERWARLVGWDEGKTAELLRQVCHTRALAKFTESVLALALVAQMRLLGEALPTRKADVYRRAFEWMLRRRRPAPGPELTANELLPHLRFLAYAMRTSGRQRWSEVEATDAFRELRLREPDEPALRARPPEDLLRACVESVGVLNVAGTEPDRRGYERRMVQFFHQSFQEYFAGTALLYGHDAAGPGTPVAKLRDLLATLEVRARPVRLNEHRFDEPVLADYWQEAVRAAVAEMGPGEADEALLMMLPNPTTPAAEARARAVFALQCLADEPKAGRHAVEAVFAAAAEHLTDEDGFNDRLNTGMDEAHAAVCESAFAGPMVEHLLGEYLRAPAEEALRVSGSLVTCLGRGAPRLTAETAGAEVGRLCRDLGSGDRRVRVRAALRFTDQCFRSDYGKLGFLTDRQRGDVVGALVGALGGDPRTATAALWALSWFTGARDRLRGPKRSDPPSAHPRAGAVPVPAPAARAVEAAARRPDLEPHAVRSACLLLTREAGAAPVCEQVDWIYELAVVADGTRPRRDLPDPAPVRSPADVARLRGLLARCPMPGAADVAVAVGALGAFGPDLVPALRDRFISNRHGDDKRDEALVYLALCGGPDAAATLVAAADTPPTEGNDFFYSRGLFGLLLLDDVELLAVQLDRACAHADLNAYAYGLAGSRDPRGRELLARFRKHLDPRVRAAVAKAYACDWMT